MNKSQSAIETEEKIFKAIENNDMILLKTLLPTLDNPNIYDENFMTPLQHAAYKGNTEIIQLLLDHVSEELPEMYIRKKYTDIGVKDLLVSLGSSSQLFRNPNFEF